MNDLTVGYGFYSEYAGRGGTKYGRSVSPCHDRMKMEKEAAVMVEKGDWRLITGPVCGSEEKLKHIPLYSIPAAFPAMGS